MTTQKKPMQEKEAHATSKVVGQPNPVPLHALGIESMTPIVPVFTGDGSFTLFSPEYEQTYHSVSGALEESMKKYVEPCKITDGMRIIDFCFGLGYNSFAAMCVARNLQIVAFENDRGLLAQLPEFAQQLSQTAMGNRLDLYQQMVQEIARQITPTCSQICVNINGTVLTIVLGDAQETLERTLAQYEQTPTSAADAAQGYFSAVFYDPFSPKKCPQLWTTELFAACYRALKNGGVLATYSCARAVRDSIRAAGFVVEDGPVVGRRSPSTIGVKKG